MARRRGFTLVELLVVIAIIATLAGILFPVVFKGQGQADKAVAASLIQQLEVAINVFEDSYGDFPPSTWDRFKRLRHKEIYPFKSMSLPGNATNTCSETLFVALSCEVAGVEPFEWKDDQLMNSDSDKLEGAPGWSLAKEAFEIRDPWGFPLVYFHNRDYGKKVKILSEDGETRTVEAQKGEKVGWQRRRSYQLFSIGPDGQPGTADDITNW